MCAHVCIQLRLSFAETLTTGQSLSKFTDELSCLGLDLMPEGKKNGNNEII